MIFQFLYNKFLTLILIVAFCSCSVDNDNVICGQIQGVSDTKTDNVNTYFVNIIINGKSEVYLIEESQYKTLYPKYNNVVYINQESECIKVLRKL